MRCLRITATGSYGPCTHFPGYDFLSSMDDIRLQMAKPSSQRFAARAVQPAVFPGAFPRLQPCFLHEKRAAEATALSTQIHLSRHRGSPLYNQNLVALSFRFVLQTRQVSRLIVHRVRHLPGCPVICWHGSLITVTSSYRLFPCFPFHQKQRSAPF